MSENLKRWRQRTLFWTVLGVFTAIFVGFATVPVMGTFLEPYTVQLRLVGVGGMFICFAIGAVVLAVEPLGRFSGCLSRATRASVRFVRENPILAASLLLSIVLFLFLDRLLANVAVLAIGATFALACVDIMIGILSMIGPRHAHRLSAFFAGLSRPLGPVYVIAALILTGVVYPYLFEIVRAASTPECLFVAVGVFCLVLATVLWFEFRRAHVPVAGLPLLVTRALTGIGVLCLLGGIVCAICATPSPCMPAPIVCPSPSPTGRPSLRPTLPPTPDCLDVQVSSCLELNLVTGTGQRKCLDDNGLIVLAPKDLERLLNLSGRPELTGINVADCTCCWKGKTGGRDWQDVTTGIGDCSFRIHLPDPATTIYLLLSVGGQSELFVVTVQEQ